jgi:hypothetical protein
MRLACICRLGLSMYACLNIKLLPCDNLFLPQPIQIFSYSILMNKESQSRSISGYWGIIFRSKLMTTRMYAATRRRPGLQSRW